MHLLSLNEKKNFCTMMTKKAIFYTISYTLSLLWWKMYNKWCLISRKKISIEVLDRLKHLIWYNYNEPDSIRAYAFSPSVYYKIISEALCLNKTVLLNYFNGTMDYYSYFMAKKSLRDWLLTFIDWIILFPVWFRFIPFRYINFESYLSLNQTLKKSMKPSMVAKPDPIQSRFEIQF